VVRAGAVLLVLLCVGAALAADVRAVVEAFVARVRDVSIADLAVTETFTLYHPDGRNVQTTGERRLFLKVPGRQRIEETIEGRREVRLFVDGRAWVRRSDGTVYEAPPAEAQRARTHLLTPSRRGAADLLAEWRALGVRDDVAHEEKFEGRTILVLGAQAGDRTSPAVWFDPERGVVRLIAREQVGGRLGLIDRTYADHRPITREFLYPHRQEMFLDGRLLTRIIVGSVDVNPGLADALFDPARLRASGR
jgi:outer membrane lipoprotein-sorting protein